MGARTVDAKDGAVPLPIVRLNRVILLVGVLIGLSLRQPLVTTALLVVLAPTVVVGARGSLIVALGRRLLAAQIDAAFAVGDVEDRRLMRFNNTIAVVLLALAQGAFLLGAMALGWALALAVAAAAAVALAGFCVGCFLYYQLRLNRYRLFNA